MSLAQIVPEVWLQRVGCSSMCLFQRTQQRQLQAHTAMNAVNNWN